MHLQNVVAGAGDGKLEGVKADAPPATREDGERIQQAGRRQVVCHDALLQDGRQGQLRGVSEQSAAPGPAREAPARTSAPP